MAEGPPICEHGVGFPEQSCVECAHAERDQLQERLRAVREWAESVDPHTYKYAQGRGFQQAAQRVLSILDGPEESG